MESELEHALVTISGGSLTYDMHRSVLRYVPALVPWQMLDPDSGQMVPAPPSPHTAVEVQVEAARLEEYLAGMTESARELFPERTPLEAVVALRLVHLDEDLDTGHVPFAKVPKPSGPSALRLDRDVLQQSIDPIAQPRRRKTGPGPGSGRVNERAHHCAVRLTVVRGPRGSCPPLASCRWPW